MFMWRMNDDDRIEKLDSNGNYLTQWGSYGGGNGQFAGPAGVAVDRSNNVYVVEPATTALKSSTATATI